MQFSVDVLDVRFHGICANEQLFSNLSIGLAIDKEQNDLLFSSRYSSRIQQLFRELPSRTWCIVVVEVVSADKEIEIDDED